MENMKTNIILEGDALTKLKELPEKSINMCMTSPPYWALRDYGTASWDGGDENCSHQYGRNTRGGLSELQKGNQGSFGDEVIKSGECCKLCGAKRVDNQIGLEPTFEEYINKLCDIFDEVKRVLRDDGTCWVNIGDTYGGSGNSSGHKEDTKNAGKLTQEYGASKGNQQATKEYQKSLVMIPFRFAIEMVSRGWILRNTIIWHKRNCMPSSAKDRFTVDFEYLFFFSKKKKYYFETQYEEYAPASDVIYRQKLRVGKKYNSKEPYKNNLPYHSIKRRSDDKDGLVVGGNSEGRNKRTVWAINPKPFSEAHFAVYPEELCETPIKAGCPIGGIVLDPFFGAGTTGIVALKQNKKFIGIELNKEYIKISKARIKPFLEQKKL